jgi:hypothetical protein
MALYRAARAALWQEIMDGGSVEAMALLVKHGADVKAHNASGDHALSLAVKNRHSAVVRWLLESKLFSLADLRATNVKSEAHTQKCIKHLLRRLAKAKEAKSLIWEKFESELFDEGYCCSFDGCCAITTREETEHCSSCKVAGYCSKQCQLKDWPNHKADCKRACAAKKAPGSMDLAPGRPFPGDLLSGTVDLPGGGRAMAVKLEGAGATHLPLFLPGSYTSCGPKWIFPPMEDTSTSEELFFSEKTLEEKKQLTKSMVNAVKHFWSLRVKGISPGSCENGNLAADVLGLFHLGASGIKIDVKGGGLALETKMECCVITFKKGCKPLDKKYIEGCEIKMVGRLL